MESCSNLRKSWFNPSFCRKWPLARGRLVWEICFDSQLKVFLSQFESARVLLLAQLSQTSKTRQKWDSKSSWNWRVILVPATIWQVLNMKTTQRPEMEVMSMPTLVRKNSWNHFEGTYFWRVFSHLELLCLALYQACSVSQFQVSTWSADWLARLSLSYTI